MDPDQVAPTSKQYPIVGRIDDTELQKYTVLVHGRAIVDYDKIKRDDPELYKKVIENENRPDPFNDVTTAS